MTSLEERSIAALRRKLIDGNAAVFSTVWSEADAIVKGGNEKGVFEDMIRRDVIAYAIVRGADVLSGYVFGGFVRAHHSGKAWSDLDIVLPKYTNVNRAWKSIMQFVTFCIPVTMRHIRWKSIPREYAMCMRLQVVQSAKSTISIDIDLVEEGDLKSFTTPFHPVTIGSFLKMEGGETTFRMRGDTTMLWKPCEVIRMLQDGEDMKIRAKISTPEYSLYYWSRILRMEQDGWVLHDCLVEEPPHPADAEISRLLREKLSL